jgi:signal transduction histidine kinase
MIHEMKIIHTQLCACSPKFTSREKGMVINMKKRERMNMIGCYIKQRLKILFMLFVFAILFSLVFHLYSLPTEAVMYSVILCAAAGMIFGIWDFTTYYRKHMILYDMLNHVTVSIEDLPQTSNLWERDYQELLNALYIDKLQIVFNTDAASSEMTDYYTLWAHQIKTPIAAMRLLLQSEESDKSSELSMELFKIEQYVEMVLQYLRLDCSSSDYILKKYDLDDLIKQAVRKYAKLFILKKISLNYESVSYSVLTDEKWLVFVIEQILSNALKYTAKGSISIYREDNSLVIEDTGMGIQEEDLPRVFEKGFTGYNGRADKKSTGIGLYLCKRILSKLSHTISIESKLGKGTRVSIGLDTLNLTVE